MKSEKKSQKIPQAGGTYAQLFIVLEASHFSMKAKQQQRFGLGNLSPILFKYWDKNFYGDFNLSPKV